MITGDAVGIVPYKKADLHKEADLRFTSPPCQ
jgi:hypothetical protein